ncbi:transposable element Tcb2 transposase [Trichonephila clavipes]|nr:transposable element Tcb2 transposase [Trichonephila clavipes]
MVYCYRCINVGFVNSSTSAAPGIACKGAFILDTPLRQTIDGCVCNGLMSTEPGKLIGTNLSFQMKHGSIFGTMRAAFVLDAMPVNAAVHSELSNDIVA